MSKDSKEKLAAGPVVVLRILRFKFLPAISPAKIDTIIGALEALPSKIDQIAIFDGGATLPNPFGSASYLYILGFHSAEELKEYEEHPAHQAFVVQSLEKGAVLDHSGSSVEDVPTKR